VHLAKTFVSKEQQARSKALIKNKTSEKSESVDLQSQPKNQIHAVSKTVDSDATTADSNSISPEQPTAAVETKYQNSKRSDLPSLTARRQVFQRDQCCQFQDPKTGLQCGSRKFLSVDHIQP
ncbi:MAG: hypothetical protein ACOYOK_12360, partial [Pseudobdellovibrionaceae bacterium]